MRSTRLRALSIVIVLVLAGCSGSPLPGGPTTGGQPAACGADGGPSPDAFPAPSALNASTFDRHADLLANTSFTVGIEVHRKIPSAQPPPQFSVYNHSTRVLVDREDGQVLSQPNGTLDYLGSTGLQSVYADERGVYALAREDNQTTVTVRERNATVDDGSGDESHWEDWGRYYWVLRRNVTFERTCVERFRGEPVMRYEAEGVDALPESYRSVAHGFSATLRIDADGVIRYYRYELNELNGTTDGSDGAVEGANNESRVYVVSDVGSTDVTEPAWVANATAAS